MQVSGRDGFDGLDGCIHIRGLAEWDLESIPSRFRTTRNELLDARADLLDVVLSGFDPLA